MPPAGRTAAKTIVKAEDFVKPGFFVVFRKAGSFSFFFLAEHWPGALLSCPRSVERPFSAAGLRSILRLVAAVDAGAGAAHGTSIFSLIQGASESAQRVGAVDRGGLFGSILHEAGHTSVFCRKPDRKVPRTIFWHAVLVIGVLWGRAGRTTSMAVPDFSPFVGKNGFVFCLRPVS